MQLPQNKADRQKVLALIGVGVVALLYGIWAGVYNPIQTKKRDAIARIAELETSIDNADRQIRRIPQIENDLKVVVTNLLNWSTGHVLYPRLGNYLLPVREVLGQQAARLNLGEIQVDEIGLIGIPRATNAVGRSAIQLYAVRVTVSCGYEDLRKWFLTIEQENPMVSAGNIMITSRREDPLRHQIAFELHYPVWRDPAYHELLQADLDAMEAASP